VVRSTRAVLEAGDYVVWADFGAGLVAGFDCALSDARNTKLNATRQSKIAVRIALRIGERVRAGLRNAKTKGQRLGRPPLKEPTGSEV
jgi:hypothetical protein